MIDKFKEAYHLLKSNFFSIFFLILTIYTPEFFIKNFNYTNLLDKIFEKLICSSICENETIKVLVTIPSYLFLSIIYFISFSLFIACLLNILSESKRGIKIGYIDSFKFGITKWFKLIKAWIIPSIYSLLGFLCFIIPGLILSVRYAFISELVVFEENTLSNIRFESNKLAMSNNFNLYIIIILSFLLGIIKIFSLVFILSLFPSEFNRIFMEFILDYFFIIISSFFDILIFLLYLDSKEKTSNIT